MNVLITGTNRGMGKAFLKKFSQEGCKVWAHARKKTDEFESLLSDLRDINNNTIEAVYCDLTDSDEMKKMVKYVSSQKEPIDVLVNNIGKMHTGLFQMTSMDTVKDIFNVNLFAPMELTQYISRIMIRQKKGAIVNVASVAGLDYDAGNSAYGLSKGGIVGFTKILSKELGELGIRVNGVAPGLTDTDMAEFLKEKNVSDDLINKSTMKRLANPDEIAEIVYFLASDRSSFVNGEIIRVDGGFY